MKTLRWIIVVSVLAVAAGVLLWWKYSPGVVRENIRDGRIRDIAPMVQLCTVEFYDEIPLKARKGSRHFFGKLGIEGSISFDLEKIETEYRGDTLVVTLPPEIVTLNESTEPGSYQVIDTWNDSFFGSSGFTAAEENEIKNKVMSGYRWQLYAGGRVRRARREAALSLKGLLSAMTGRVVEIKDDVSAE